LADAVLLAVSERLAPRFVVKPGAASGLSLQVQGMNLERYAQLMRLLDPFGARLKSVEGDRITFEVSGSADQVRSQLSLAKLQEVSAAEVEPIPAAAVAPVDGAVAAPGAAPMILPAAGPELHFRW
jgi:hypothetical protein